MGKLMFNPAAPDAVINNLTSDSTTDALSAAQGKVLNDIIGITPPGKNIQQEIDTLNDKVKGIAIAANTDLNSLTTPGNYYSSNSTRSATLTNAPITTDGFSLVVTKKGNYTEQQAQAGGVVYVRGSSSSGFSEWQELALNSNLQQMGIDVGVLNSKVDPLQNNALANCNDATSSGRYKAINSTTNTPFTGHFVIDVIWYNSTEATMYAQSTGSNRFFIRYYNNGTWSAWEELALNSKLPISYSKGAVTAREFYGISGFLTTSATYLALYVPIILSPDVTDITNISITNAGIRISDGGYVIGNGADLTQYVIGAYVFKLQGLIRIDLNKSDGWGFTNNSICIGNATLSFTLS